MNARPFPRDLVASVVGPVVLVGGTGVTELIGFIIGTDPKEFAGLVMAGAHMHRLAAAWLTHTFPELEALLECPDNLQAAEAYVAELGLSEVFIVPQLPGAGSWTPPAAIANGADK